MAESLIRQWTILQSIPVEPRFITISALKGKLDALGYSVDRRTIQRDLVQLSEPFKFSSNEEPGKATQWFWPKDMAVCNLPGMSVEAAFAFTMMEGFLSQSIPAGLLDRMAPYFLRARGIMSEESIGGLANWSDKIRFLPKGLKLLQPKIDPEVRDTVLQSLLKERQLKINYQKPWETEPTWRVVNPLGLVHRNEVTYLIAKDSPPKKQPKQFVLSRIMEAELLEMPCAGMQDFSLDDYLTSGAFAYPLKPGKKIRLKLLLHPDIIFIPKETPLSEDQRLTEDEDEWWLLEATVEDTQELRWWIQSFGAEIIVLTPKSIRQEMLSNWKWLAAHYEG